VSFEMPMHVCFTKTGSFEPKLPALPDAAGSFVHAWVPAAPPTQAPAAPAQ
jgi:hypothetical protein